jgi:NDP-sugar pyrophosphorylase family protein
MHIIIPMSGIGKRFVDAGYTVPKPLIVVEGKPIIQHVVELFRSKKNPNINIRYTFICNDLHLKTTNMREVLLSIVPDAQIVEVPVVSLRKGPVDAVLQHPSILCNMEPTIVSYCDYGTQWDFDGFLEKNNETDADGAIACYTGFHPHMLGSDNYAFCRTTGDNYLVEIKEKEPFTNNRTSEYASNGTYYFRNGTIVQQYFQQLVDENLHVNGEFYVSLVYNLMCRDGLKTLVYEIQKMLQWGTPKDLEEYLVWSNYFLHRTTASKQPPNNTVLILPMAGAGSRFFHEGYKTPKPLLEIEGKPMVVQAVSCLPPTCRKIFICQESHVKKYGIDAVLKKEFPESEFLQIDYVTEGQACTCELACKNIDMNNPVMISACDNGAYYNTDSYQRLVDDPDVDIIVWSFSNNPTSRLYPHMYAWLDVDSEGSIRQVSIKKPLVGAKHAIVGTMLFKKGAYFLEGLDEIYRTNSKTNGEFYVDNVLEPLIRKGYRCKIFNVDNYLCWGTPNDYKTYCYWAEYFLR